MKQTESPLTARIVLGIVAAIGMSIPIGITIKTKLDLNLLERTAKATNGSVTGKTCSNHGKIYFSYVVDGTRHDNSGNSCGLTCDSAKAGDKLRVIYSSERPQLSRCGSIESSKSNVTGNFVAIVFASLLLGYAIFRVTRFENTSNSSSDTDGQGRGST